MKIELFHTANAKFLKKAVDVYTQKHNAIAQNVANAHNPDWVRKDTDFSDLLKSKMTPSRVKTTDERHIATAHFGAGKSEQPGGEQSVDLAQEMAELSENQIRHELASRALYGHYQKLKAAITGKM